MRSRDARRSRLRALTTAVALVGGTAVGALAVWRVYQWGIDRFIYQNDAFAIRRVEIRQSGRLKPETIQRWVGIQPGQNLLALDLGRVRHDLELNPWIERADAETHRPDCLRLAVWERQPAARIVIWRLHPETGQAWAVTNLVDGQAQVLPPLPREWVRSDEDLDFSDLPRLTGLDPTQVIPGQCLSHPQVPAALELIRAYRASSVYAQVDLDEIDVSQPGVLIGTSRQGAHLTFGLVDHALQMRRWRSIHDYLRSQGRELETLDLSVTNNLPARLRRAEADPSTRLPVSSVNRTHPPHV